MKLRTEIPWDRQELADEIVEVVMRRVEARLAEYMETIAAKHRVLQQVIEVLDKRTTE